LRIINPLEWNLFWGVPLQRKPFGLMKLFALAAGTALTWLAIPSPSSPTWGAPARFVRTGTVLREFRRRLKPVLWIAFTGLLLMISKAYKRSLILRSFFRSDCLHLRVRDASFLGSRKAELR
jgi:hypothetical protein